MSSSCCKDVSFEKDMSIISKMNFTEFRNYSIGDRNSSIYFIHYGNNYYHAYMPLESDSLTKLYHLQGIYDSSGNFIKNNIIDIYDDTAKRMVFNKICLNYRQIWQIDYKNICLLEMSADEERNLLLKLLWKGNNAYYNIIITHDSLESALKKIDTFYLTHKKHIRKKEGEINYYFDYKKFNNILYYRKLVLHE